MNHVLVLTAMCDNEQHIDELRIKLTKVMDKYSEMDRTIITSKVFMLGGE